MSAEPEVHYEVDHDMGVIRVTKEFAPDECDCPCGPSPISVTVTVPMDDPMDFGRWKTVFNYPHLPPCVAVSLGPIEPV